MPKISRLAGILCVGQNHNQAVENFRQTAIGKNTMFYASKDGVAFASNSSVDLYNPNGGSELLVERPDLVAKAEFQSESSSADVKAYYTICLDGCGSHVISDSSANIQGCCPSCSADLSEITDERVQSFLAESASASQTVEHEGLVATGATAEEAQRNFVQALSNAHAFTALSGSGSFNAATHANFDPYTGAKVTSNEPKENVEALSSSVEGDEVEAHMYSCSANCEQPFTVSSDEEPVFCAHCSGGLLDIESESGDDDSDIDILDDEDLDSDDVEEDDDVDSESSDDDEEDFDEDDLDEDDLDDEDFDADEDEDEDIDSESGSDDEDDEDFDEDDIDDEDDLDDEDLDEEDLDDEDIDSESGSGDDEDDLEDEDDEDLDFDEDEDLDEDDLDLDDDEDIESESGAVSCTFDSLSAAQAQHGNLDPALVSLSRATGGKVDSVFMNYDGMPIARATFASVSNAISEESAAKNFATDNFIRAISVSLNQNGVSETCNSFGFMPFTIEMPVDKLLVAQSDARISETTETVNATITEAVEANKERLISALSAAQLGIVKNFWGDARNPIVESLCSTLQSAGLKEPRALIERAFISHGKDYLAVALSKAMDLMSKSEVAQNEISESINAAAGTLTAATAAKTVVQQAVVAQPINNSANDLLNQEHAPVNVQSQSSASTGSFEDKLKRLRG